MQHSPRLRLLKMIVQPVYVLDDGETLTERPGEPFALPPSEVATFPDVWAERFAALREQVEAEAEAPDVE